MRKVLFVISAVLAGLVTPAAGQQDVELIPPEESGDTLEPIRRYSVELIIFVYDESVSSGTEIWLAEEGAIEPERRAGFGRIFGDRAGELAEIEAPAISRAYMDIELERLDRKEFTMNGIYDKLDKLDAYQPLVHAGWTQSTFDKAVTAPIPLRTLARSPPWLDGSLTLYLGRYLHLVVDLTMQSDRDAGPGGTGTGLSVDGDSRPRHDYVAIDQYGNPLLPPVRYRIFEDRIMKNGDIRYFDHPKFGVIAKTTRVEEANEEIIDDTDDLLPGSIASH